MSITRRSFFTQSAAVTTGFTGLGRFLNAETRVETAAIYGSLVPDEKKIIDLPKGFSYRVLSRTGDPMTDGFRVPGQPDGMGCFEKSRTSVTLVRNHEIGHSHHQLGPFADNKVLPDSIPREMSYDPGRFGAQPFVGGTTTLVYNTNSGRVESQFLSLTGTDRNCAGGITPWGSWITCEEPGDTMSQWGKAHGYNFEVPAGATGLTKPVPLRAMGRFRHEAIAVDPDSGFIYQTEDRGNSVIYRFIPDEKSNPAAGGKLQALQVRNAPTLDTRNHDSNLPAVEPGNRMKVDWIDLEDVETIKDDLRLRAAEKGAAIFSRGEGMWFGNSDEVGEPTIYWACTDGGIKKNGQIFRLFPETDEMDLYLEPNDSDLLQKADNITVSPGSGHLFICEDSKGDNFVRGVTTDGRFFTFARNAVQLKGSKSTSEFCGACFSPDGSHLFVNIQSPGITLAISGPFV